MLAANGSGSGGGGGGLKMKVSLTNGKSYLIGEQNDGSLDTKEDVPKKRHKSGKTERKKKEEQKPGGSGSEDASSKKLKRKRIKVLDENDLEEEASEAQRRETERLERIKKMDRTTAADDAWRGFEELYDRFMEEPQSSTSAPQSTKPLSSAVEDDIQVVMHERPAPPLFTQMDPYFGSAPTSSSSSSHHVYSYDSHPIPYYAPTSVASCPTQPSTSAATAAVTDDVITLSSDEEDGGSMPAPMHTVTNGGGPFLGSLSAGQRALHAQRQEEEIERLRLARRRRQIERLDEDLDLGMGNVAASTAPKLVVNSGHGIDEPDVYVAPHLATILQPHQLGGVRFMWDNVVETLADFEKAPGFGCILAHSMGLGKTLQTITFTEVFLRATPAKHAMIVVPVNTIQNWWSEFNKWLPENAPCGRPPVFMMGDSVKTATQRAELLLTWRKSGGVLLIGYELFRLLLVGKSTTEPKKASAPKRGTFSFYASVELTELNGDGKKEPTLEEQAAKVQRENFLKIATEALLMPGPDLVVCDEGHRIKNLKTAIAGMLGQIRTRRRVVLTGYPLQNNLLEYYCMVDFVRPMYLGTKKSFQGHFERPIQNGLCLDSTPTDIKLSRQRTHVLVEKLKGFVQRRTSHILEQILPERKEWVLLVRKSPIQHTLYRAFLLHARNAFLTQSGSMNPLRCFAQACKIWNHPDVLSDVLRKKCRIDKDIEIDDDCTANGGSKKPGNASKPVKKSQSVPTLEALIRSDLSVTNMLSPDQDYSWAEGAMQFYQRGCLENGYKLALAVKIIKKALRLGEKVLFFSQSLFTLDVVEEFLAAGVLRNETDEDTPGCSSSTADIWRKGSAYLRLDGSSSGVDRERMIERFNSDPGCKLMLISTKAGSLGINLVAASRVIIFDASWNPCHDAQAVCRVYRYGQRRRTFIYRLIMDNSMERAIFNRQIGKAGLQQRVVDDSRVDANVTRSELESLLAYDEAKDVIHMAGELAELSVWADDEGDAILGTVVRENPLMMAQAPFPHSSLLMERTGETLSEDEKREAQLLYERERAATLFEDGARMPTIGGGGGGYGPTAAAANQYRRHGLPWRGPLMPGADEPSLRATPVPKTLTYVAGELPNSLPHPHPQQAHVVLAAQPRQSWVPGLGMMQPFSSTQDVAYRDEHLLVVGDSARRRVRLPAGTPIRIIRNATLAHPLILVTPDGLRLDGAGSYFDNRPRAPAEVIELD